MTKIDIYSGFLGAGKTTLIKKLIEEAYKGERVVLIENDSVIAVGGSLIEAFDALEVVEFTANTLIHGGLIGQIVKITDEEVKTINEAFNLD